MGHSAAILHRNGKKEEHHHDSSEDRGAVNGKRSGVPSARPTTENGERSGVPSARPTTEYLSKALDKGHEQQQGEEGEEELFEDV